MGVLEEIKKEIKKTFYIDEDDMHFEKANINIDSLFEILDKYNNQPDYKGAWEEFKKIVDDDNTPRLANLMSDGSRRNIEYEIKKLEEEFNLGGK